MTNIKNLSEQEYFNHIEDCGHILKRLENGSVDIFGMDDDYHNGPACVRAGCYTSWCMHCRREVENCKEANCELIPLTIEDAMIAAAHPKDAT